MNRRNLLTLAVTAAVFVVIQVLINAGVLNRYWTIIVQLACIFVIYSLGLNLIYGYTGQFSLGHAAFYGLGAYSAALLTKIYIPGVLRGIGLADLPAEVYFPFALLLGGIVAAVVAYLIGLPILRLGSDYLGIATLGFGVIVKVLFDNADSLIPAMGGAQGMTGIPALTTFAWAFPIAVGVVILIRNLIYSGQGRAFLAIREDEIAANTMGVNPFRYKMMAFVFGCFLAGVAGGLHAHLYLFEHPSNFDFLKSVDVLTIVVLGGLGSISGTIIAAVGWTFLLELLRNVLPPELIDFRFVVFPLLLIVMMLLRPSGLMGGFEVPFLRPLAIRWRGSTGGKPGGPDEPTGKGGEHVRAEA